MPELLVSFHVAASAAGDVMTALGPIMDKVADFEMVTVRDAPRAVKAVRNTPPRNPDGGLRGCDATLLRAFNGPAWSINTQQPGDALVAAGYSVTSISPTVSRLARQGFVKRLGGGLYQITDAGWAAAQTLTQDAAK